MSYSTRLAASALVSAIGVLSMSSATMADMLKKLLGERIPAYMVPRKFQYLESFPMTPNGKADRRKLAELLEGGKGQ